jgi:uncharacterized protein
MRIDAGHLIIVGHSMGGYIAAHIAADSDVVLGVALISPANIGSAFGLLPRSAAIAAVDENVGTSAGLHILAGTSPERLVSEVKSNAACWRLERHAQALAARPLLVITADDGFRASTEAFEQAVATSGQLTRLHFTTDHSYSDHRIALQVAALEWLDKLGIVKRQAN